MRAPSSTIELLDLVKKSGILPGNNLEEKLSDFPNLPSDPAATAALFVKQGVLTRFQAKLLLTGRWRGFKLGSYVVREQIGQGGMGAVYLAEHETLKRQVALKVLPPAKGDQNAKLNVERFLREARAVAALDHPNIVRIHDVGHQGDVHYLVMEYVEGQTLEDLLRKGGPITPSRAVEYIAQAAAGLQHAHEKGFIHRDIKPANLMLTRDGIIKILDMGLARSSSNESDKLTERMDEGAIVGTADFISPEQAINAPNIDIRSDIYSLGATFYALVTGTPPFSGNTTQKLVQHQMKEPPSLTTIDRTFPPELAKVVAKMLNKKPEKRYQTPGEVITAVAEWLPNAGAQRMVVSLSGTDLAHSVEMQATLSELASGGTARISASKRLGATVGKLPWKLYAGVGTAVAAAVAVVVWVVLSGTSTKDTSIAINSPNNLPLTGTPVPSPTAPTTPPKVVPTKTTIPTNSTPVNTVSSSAAQGRVVSNFDPEEIETFRAVFQSSTLREGRLGKLPNGWTCQTYKMGSVGDFRVEAINGQKVMMIAAAEGEPATQLVFRPDRANMKTFEPGKTYEVRFEVRTDSGAKGYSSVQIVGDWKTIASTEFSPDGWKRYSHKFTMPETGEVQVTVGSRTVSSEQFVYLRKLEIAVIEPTAPAGPGVQRFALKSEQIQPFVESGLVVMGANDQKVWKVQRKTGSWPENWTGRPWRENDEVEYFADGEPGRLAIGSKIISGRGSAMILTPEIDGFDGRAFLQIEYQTISQSTNKYTVRFLPTKPTKEKAFDVAKLDPTLGEWKSANLELDLKSSTAGRIEFHNSDTGPGSEFRLRKVVVSTWKSGGTLANNSVVEGTSLRTLDLGSVQPFRTTCIEGKLEQDVGSVLPPGIHIGCWNLESVSEFRANEVEGRVGLGITNLNDTISSQFLLHGLGNLTQGARYRVKIDYLTKNDANGKMMVRKPKENYLSIATANLPTTNGQWKTATVDFVRPPKEDEVDLQVINQSVGEGNTLYIHKIEIVSLSEDAKARPQVRTQQGTQGAKIFSVEFGSKVPFQYTIQDKKPSLETWKVLPGGVKGLCWKNESEAEFRGVMLKGKAAFGALNVKGPVSTQIQIDFAEGPHASKYLAGKSYRIEVQYLTSPDTTAKISVRKPKDKFTKILQKELPGTSGEWATETIDFVALADTQLDAIIENLSSAPGNAVYIASIDIYELK